MNFFKRLLPQKSQTPITTNSDNNPSRTYQPDAYSKNIMLLKKSQCQAIQKSFQKNFKTVNNIEKIINHEFNPQLLKNAFEVLTENNQGQTQYENYRFAYQQSHLISDWDRIRKSGPNIRKILQNTELTLNDYNKEATPHTLSEQKYYIRNQLLPELNKKLTEYLRSNHINKNLLIKGYQKNYHTLLQKNDSEIINILYTDGIANSLSKAILPKSNHINSKDYLFKKLIENYIQEPSLINLIITQYLIDWIGDHITNTYYSAAKLINNEERLYFYYQLIESDKVQYAQEITNMFDKHMAYYQKNKKTLLNYEAKGYFDEDYDDFNQYDEESMNKIEYKNLRRMEENSTNIQDWKLSLTSSIKAALIHNPKLNFAFNQKSIAQTKVR